MKCAFQPTGEVNRNGRAVLVCQRARCGRRGLMPPSGDVRALQVQCSGWPLAHEWREWLTLFSASSGVSRAAAICQFIRWRSRGSPLEELPPLVPRPVLERPDRGPGTELKKMLAQLGAIRTAGCGCDEMISKMNAWGPGGCREHRSEIVAHLRAAYKDLDWSSAAKAVAAGALAAWSLKLNPIDPLGSLVDEAIRRSENRDAEKKNG